MSRDRLRLAVPNKGRLLEPTTALLRDAGLVFEDQGRALVSHAQNVALDILSVRTEDVVEFVGDGAADLGVTGANLLAESGAELPVLLELGYGRCALEAAVPADAAATTLADLAGMRLATTHPNLTRHEFDQRAIPVEVVQVSGAVEVAPRMGLADGIVDLVSTGSTLVMNGLRSVGRLLPSQAVLVGAARGRRPPGGRDRHDDRRGHRRPRPQVPHDERADRRPGRDRGPPARPGIPQHHAPRPRRHGRRARGRGSG